MFLKKYIFLQAPYFKFKSLKKHINIVHCVAHNPKQKYSLLMKNPWKFLVFLYIISGTLSSCSKFSTSQASNTSALTGWKLNDERHGDFAINQNYKEQKTPPGMVLIEGGTFTMGSVQEDIMADWNTTPKRMQVRSFYMDEAEVTNAEYLLYLLYTEKIFPPRNENYRHIYEAALPDTLVWRNELGSNETLSKTYLRHPAYANYPVVGVSWLQANDYCEWRTDIVNQKALMDIGVLKPLLENDSIRAEGKNHFNTETYLLNPNLIFDEGANIYHQGSNKLEDKDSQTKEAPFNGKHVKLHHGILTPDFRLPTEAEWEYAAKAVIENREYNTLRGRKKYPWNGKYTRNKSKSKKGDQLANFKQGKGDYSGIAGWSSDGADITNKIKSYPANAFGLYDMAGNVAEWVFDVYRPIIDTEMNDFNYARGNLFLKKVIDQNGKVNIANYEDLVYDTLPNGKLVPKNIPGKVMYVPITKEDSKLRFNYHLANNASVNDGDLINSRHYRKEAREITEKSRMYNAPLSPKSYLDEESGSYKTEYDSKLRTTAIDDQSRVYKGGSWKDREFWLDPAQRRFLPQYMGAEFIGFRCAMDKLGPMGKGKKHPFTKK